MLSLCVDARAFGPWSDLVHAQGTMVGAGVLALPTVARDAGFVPSSASLVAVWAYMVVTGLLISGKFGCHGIRVCFY